MKNRQHHLIMDGLDKKLNHFKPLVQVSVPPHGWINAIRTTLKMSLRQLSVRLQITPQSVKEIEQREASGTITLKRLEEVAGALDMKLVYGFVPKADSIEKMIEKRAKELASEIVLRASQTMKLEGQENSKIRIYRSIEEKAQELAETMPKYLWD